MESGAVFLSLPGCLSAPGLQPPWKESLERPPSLAGSSWAHSCQLTALLCALPPSLPLIIWPSEGICFLMAFTCSRSPHPARTAGSTLSTSLWPRPHPGSLEIVLSSFFSFCIILSLISTLPGSAASEPRLLSTPVSVPLSEDPRETGSLKQEASSLDTHPGRVRLILLPHLWVITVFGLENASRTDTD